MARLLPGLNAEVSAARCWMNGQKTPGQRGTKLAHLPERMRTPPEAEKACDVCHHPLHVTTTEVQRELEIIPPEVKVIEHVKQGHMALLFQHSEALQ